MPKRKNTERQQSRLAKQQRQRSPSPPDLTTIASSSRRGFRAPEESSDSEHSARSPRSPEYHSQPPSPPPWVPPLPSRSPSPMSGEAITAAQVLQALSGLGDKVSSAFDAIEVLTGKTPDPTPTASSSSKKTAKAPKNFNGSIKGGHAFL